MEHRNIGQRYDQDAGNVGNEIRSTKRKALFVLFEMRVAEAHKHRIGDNSERRERTQEGSRVPGAGYQDDVHTKEASQQIKPPEKMAGKSEERSRLGVVAPSRSAVGVDSQSFLA